MSATASSGHDAAANAAADARLKRLRWRCRRGTRELDDLLGGWLERHAAAADGAALQAFDAMLDRQDPEILDWLLGHAEPPRADWRGIIAGIRKHAGLAT